MAPWHCGSWTTFRYAAFFDEVVLYRPMAPQAAMRASMFSRWVHSCRVKYSHYANLLDLAFLVGFLYLAVTLDGTTQMFGLTAWTAVDIVKVPRRQLWSQPCPALTRCADHRAVSLPRR